MRSGMYLRGIIAIALTVLVGAGGCATKPSMSMPSTQLVRDHMSRFNAQDIEGLGELVTDDIAWYTIEDDTMVAHAQGVDGLIDGLTQYFEALPTVRAEIEHIHTAGSFVVARERVTWLDKEGKEQSQASYAIYQIQDGKIESVWYFEAE